VAAVVRLAPDSGRLFKAPNGHAVHVRSALHVRSVGHAGSRAHTSSRASGPSAGSVPSGTHTGAASQHVRFATWHGHGRGKGWHRASFTAHGQFAHERHDSAGGGWHRGWSVARQSAGAVPGTRHGTLERYAGGRGHHDPLQSDARGQGRHDAVGGADSGRADRAEPARRFAPGGNHRGRNK